MKMPDCIVLLVGLTIMVSGCGPQDRHPNRLLIPSGFVGRISIEYGVPGAPALPMEDGHYVYRIPKQGRLQTRTGFPSGSAADDDYYYVLNGERTRLRDAERDGAPVPPGIAVWGPSVGGRIARGVRSPITAVFFISSKQPDWDHLLPAADSARAPISTLEVGPHAKQGKLDGD